MSAETIKLESRYLAGTIGEELVDGTDDFGDESESLLKFHGIYQQDDRDVRRARTARKLPLDYSCMVRASVPGGEIDGDQWSALDRVANIADGRLRLTSRQGVQYHMVHKGDLRPLVAGINASLLTTLGACGDVVRNVMACPLPHPERRAVLEPVVAEMVARFRPQTESYWELWVDGEAAVTSQRWSGLDPTDDVEPVYGAAYLPRKFKIAVAWPGDNCVDVYTNDVGIVPTLTDGTSGELTGFVVLAGGGMGMSHNRPDDTYPLLAQPIAWVPPSELGDVVEAIVTTQRDHGDREDRSRARLKYLLEAKGVDWLRDQIEQRTGRRPADPVGLPEWEVEAHHGWHEVAPTPHRHEHVGDAASSDPSGRSTPTPGTSSMTLGLPVPSGRVEGGLRRALGRLVADGTVAALRVTPRQDLLLLGVDPRSVAAVENVLRANGVALAADRSPVRNLAIACVALPTCSKALGEAERVLPDVVERIEKVLADTGNEGLPIRLNMTGCPNGCSRPYAAELGIVGRSKRGYDVYVGGSPAGDRLARRVRADVDLDDVPELLRPLLEHFARVTSDDRPISFGDWAASQDPATLDGLLPPDTSRRARRAAARAEGGGR